MDRKPEFFADKGIKIGIIGCGYVGLPLALRFADVGQRVTGFDLDQSKIEKLNAGQSYIQHIPAEKIKAHVDAKHFDATSDFTRLREMDAVLICVPTPLDERREPDLSYVENTARAIAPNLQRNQLIVLESTTYPGTTEELVLPDSRKGRLALPHRARRRRRKRRNRFLSRFLPGARRSRQQAIRSRADSQSSRWHESPRADAPPRGCTRRSSRKSFPSAPRAPPKW